MTIASDLLQQHIQTLLDDNARWQTLIVDDLLWELAYAPALGHPARLTGREQVMRHVNWFRGAVENFRFFDIRVYDYHGDCRAHLAPDARTLQPHSDGREAKGPRSTQWEGFDGRL